MLYLQATKKARDALGIGREVLDVPGQAKSLLGHWVVNVVPIGDRYALLFMSCRSLLSFPIFIGQWQPGLQDIPSLLSHGITLLTQAMRMPASQASRLLGDLDEIAICKALDKSLLGVFSAVAADYFHLVDHSGGLANSNLDAVVANVNSRPRATLGWKDSFEVSRELLKGSVA